MVSSKKPRKENAWNQHLSEVRKKNPGLSFADANKLAKKSYKKGDADVKHKSHSAVDLSRHDGRIDSDEKEGSQGSPEKTESAASPGEQTAPRDQAAGRDQEISFQDDKVEVENPTIKPDPARIEVIPSEKEGEKKQEKISAPIPTGISGDLLKPFFKLITDTTGLILAKKYKDNEFRKIWHLEDFQVESISDASALLLNKYVPSAGEDSELTAFLLSAGVVFGPVAFATYAKISDINEKEEERKEQAESRPEAPVEPVVSQKDIVDSFNSKRLPGGKK